MPSNDKRHDLRKALSRRRYVQALVGAGVAGLAGCGGDGDGATPTPTDTDEQDPSTPGGDDPTPTPTQSGGEDPGETDTDTPTDTPDQRTLVEGARDITTTFNQVPEQSNLNPWAQTPRNTGIIWLQEVPYGQNVVSREWYLDGKEFQSPWKPSETITVPTIIRDIEIEPPFDYYYTLNDDPLTYWDGETPIDATARMQHNYINNYALNNDVFDDTATFNTEVVSDNEVHEWRNKGDVEGQEPNPANLRTLSAAQNALWGDVPFYPGFTTPYYEQYQDAGSADEVANINSSLRGDRVSLFDYADEEMGSGSYAIPSSDAIGSQGMDLEFREDHPVAEHANVPNLRVEFANADRQEVLQEQGDIDMLQGDINEEDRDAYPDYMQTIDRYPATATDLILFNMNNDHLERLWFRRAVIAAVDWIQVDRNGWGAQGAVPAQYHTGANNAASQRAFSSEFLESLYQYPMRSDTDLASEWMTNAGYTKTGGNWTGPNGNTASLGFMWNSGIGGWQPAVQTVADNLRSFGIQVEINGYNQSAYRSRLAWDNLGFDMALKWGPDSPQADVFYNARGPWWDDPMLDGDTEDGNRPDEGDERDAENAPLQVQIPTEVGSIEAPNGPVWNPDLAGNGIDSEEIDIIAEINAIRSPDSSEERIQTALERCARYYNYYVPQWLMHSLSEGFAANVQDFQWAPTGHPVNRTWWNFHTDHLQAHWGIPQGRYQDE